jgi:Insulinase (Peptidase family M16)
MLAMNLCVVAALFVLLSSVAGRPFGLDVHPGMAAMQARNANYAKVAARQLATNNDTQNDKSDSSGKIFAYPYEQYQLESNGLPVIIVPLDDFPGLVSVHITINAGSRNEVEPGKTGMAHFFEHMMFRGTNNISGEEFDSTYQELGARYNAWTWLDVTNYYAVFPKTSDSLEVVMRLESDRFQNLNYTEDLFKTEAGAILGEYNTYAGTSTMHESPCGIN